MARSKKRSVALPVPLIDALEELLSRGVIDYPSLNAAIVGLSRYAVLHGGPHSLTSAVARFHETDQDVIDDFLLELTQRGQGLTGQFLRVMTERVCRGLSEPEPGEVTRLQAAELLDLAHRWRRGEDVWQALH